MVSSTKLFHFLKENLNIGQLIGKKMSLHEYTAVVPNLDSRSTTGGGGRDGFARYLDPTHG